MTASPAHRKHGVAGSGRTGWTAGSTTQGGHGHNAIGRICCGPTAQTIRAAALRRTGQ
ncbi:hypothetical protein IFJ82_04040 [Novacetimonas hansenii]|uniref:hypothetical protein n=1 Tax=Novacetimonas hansenii TaxID=436 RepID=UPI0017806165|nr:hypothetical protein [Novacetimonas hansenii]QOF95820.1 hypothetical protein IFJ82_04040 [Novacetimonas hansenii]